MRRRDREIPDRADIDRLLMEAPVCRLALATGDEPYIVPMSFGYDGEALYLHSAPEGKKIAMIRENPRCCFELDRYDGIVKGDRPCSWGMRYTSVIGFGRAEILEDPAGKQYGLSCIMRHYDGGTHEFSDKEMKSVTVIRIVIESMTGKKKE